MEVSIAREIYANVNDMVAADSLSSVTGENIRTVDLEASSFDTSRSGSVFQRIATNGGVGPAFVLKRMSLARDWIMRATNDTRCRSITLWQSGLLDRLRPGVDDAILASAHDGDGWAILMRDVSEALIDTVDRPIDHLEDAILYPLLDGLAALHAAFWESPALSTADLDLCTPHDYFACLSPETGRKMLGAPSVAPGRIVEGHKILPRYVDAGTYALLETLWADPIPLLAALNRYPQTLNHGDPQTNNLALERHCDGSATVIMLDWQVATWAPVTVDLFWLLDDRILDDAVADHYLSALAGELGSTLERRQWQEMLALGSLSWLLRCSFFYAYHAEYGGSSDFTERLRTKLHRLSALALAAQRLL